MTGASTLRIESVTLLERLVVRALPGQLELRLEALGALPGIPGCSWLVAEASVLPLVPGQPLPRPGDRLVRALARFLRRHSGDGELLAAVDRILRQPPSSNGGR